MAALLVLVAIPVLFLKGSIWAAEHFLPALTRIGEVLFAIDVLLLLPLSLVASLRPWTGAGIYLSSYVFGATLWLGSLVITYSIWGVAAVVIGVLMVGVGLLPIALVAAGTHDLWPLFWDLVLAAVCTFGARVVGLLIASMGEPSGATAEVGE